MLFTIYINDLVSVITHSQPFAYVDDSQLHFKFYVSDSSSAMAAVNQFDEGIRARSHVTVNHGIILRENWKVLIQLLCACGFGSLILDKQKPFHHPPKVN